MEKLCKAFYTNNYDKLEKYLNRGADPNINDNQLYKYAISTDNIILLKILLKYNVTCVRLDKSLITLAFSFNSQKCLRILLELINIDDYENTGTFILLKRNMKTQDSEDSN